MIQNKFFIFFSAFLGLLLMLATPTLAQEKIVGEIVNLNSQYKVAFTDLVTGQVQVGDVVEVFQEGDFIVYMEVLETSPAISKLGFVSRKGLSTTEVGFAEVAIGSNVIKVKQGDVSQNLEAMISQMYELQKKNEMLEMELKNKDSKISTTAQERESYQKQIDDLNQKSQLLRERLKSVSDLLKEKIAIYESY